jgi:hypothetical protein
MGPAGGDMRRIIEMTGARAATFAAEAVVPTLENISTL